MSEPLSHRQKNDFYTMLIHMKIAADYAELLQEDGKIEMRNGQYVIAKSLNQRAKFILKDVMNFNNNLIMRFRNALTTTEGREAFDNEWKKDYLAWDNIFQAMAQMNEEGISLVETFCNDLLAGNVQFEASEQLKEQEQ